MTETDQRVLEVQRCITSGLNLQEIYQYGQDKWNADPETVKGYLREARKKFADIPEEEWKAARGVLLSRCNELYQKSCEGNDFRTCLEIIKYIGKMFRLDVEEEKGRTININFEGCKIDEYD